MAKRLFMQLISCLNVLTVMQNGLNQLEDDWKAFEAAHPVIAKKLACGIPPQLKSLLKKGSPQTLNMQLRC